MFCESNISESNMCEGISFSLRKFEPIFIISKAFINLSFQVLNFVLLSRLLVHSSWISPLKNSSNLCIVKFIL